MRDEADNTIMVLSAYGHHQKSQIIVIEHAIGQMPKRISLSRDFAPKDSAGNILMDTLSQREIQSKEETMIYNRNLFDQFNSCFFTNLGHQALH